MSWLKPCVAELVATFALVFVGAGSIVADSLPGTGGFGTLGIALAHGIVLAVFVSAIMGISGGHVNPVVTIAAMATKKIPNDLAIRYIISQLIGAALGAFAITKVFPIDPVKAVNYGVPMLAAGVTQGTGILMEAILTFFLVFVIFGTAVDERAPKLGGLAIGLVLVFDILVGGGVTGAAMNPARAFGPALFIKPFNWNAHMTYWIGPLAGALVAAFLYDRLFLKK